MKTNKVKWTPAALAEAQGDVNQAVFLCPRPQLPPEPVRTPGTKSKAIGEPLSSSNQSS